MNGDGIPDVVVGGPQDLSLATPGWINVLFNDGHANLAASPTYPAGGLLMNSLVIVYFIWTLRRRKPLNLKWLDFPMPSLWLSIAQLVMAL